MSPYLMLQNFANTSTSSETSDLIIWCGINMAEFSNMQTKPHEDSVSLI